MVRRGRQVVDGTERRVGPAGVAGAERSEAEAAPAGPTRRRRPGRRTTRERTEAVLELLGGKASVDQLASRFGVHASTIESWRREAVEGIDAALRRGTGKTPREAELEKSLRELELAFASVAKEKELLRRAYDERRFQHGRFRK